MATVLHDRLDRDVRLTDERIAHISEHAEMVGQLDRVKETEREPDVVVRSQRDPTFTCTISITRPRLSQRKTCWWQSR